MKARAVSILMLVFASGCGSDDKSSSVGNECILQSGVERTKGNDYYVFETDSNLATDPQTGLTWGRCPLGQTADETEDPACGGASEIPTYSWSAALAAVQDANQEAHKGHTDWRLPNLKELASLVDTACANVTMNTDVFLGVRRGRYWSSSPSVDDFGYAWAVDFSNGQVLPVLKRDSYSVWLVRGGD